MSDLISSASLDTNSLIEHEMNAMVPFGGALTASVLNGAVLNGSVLNGTTILNGVGTTAPSHSGSSGRSTPNNSDPAPGKLFVGGLSWQTSSEKLREYFGMFGSVTDVLIMKDPVTQV